MQCRGRTTACNIINETPDNCDEHCEHTAVLREHYVLDREVWTGLRLQNRADIRIPWLSAGSEQRKTGGVALQCPFRLRSSKQREYISSNQYPPNVVDVSQKSDMSKDMNDYHDWYSPGQWEPQESWLHEHEDTVDESQAATPADPVRYDEAASRASPAPPSQRLRSRKPRRSLQDRLPLLQLEDWDPEREYARDSPTCVHYDLEWKVTSNGKQISKDTERNLVLGPASCVLLATHIAISSGPSCWEEDGR